MYMVPSSEDSNLYTLHLQEATCGLLKPCYPHCEQKECGYICRHRITCSCHDYKRGHPCKHCHAVSMRLQLAKPSPQPHEDTTALSSQQHEENAAFYTPVPKRQKLSGMCTS